MKGTGIIRRIDELGRIVIPKEIRRNLRIKDGDPLELFTDGNDSVIFKKYSPLGIRQDIVHMASSALRKQGILHAIYDNSCLITDNSGGGVFPKIVPEDWDDKRAMFTSGKETVFPIIAGGELIGYISVRDPKHPEYIQAIVNMISASEWL